MRRDRQRINRRALHDLLVDGFTPEELSRLCRYAEPRDLHSIPKEFAPGDSLPARADKIIQYCERHKLLAELLAEVEQANPRLYERYASRLRPAPGLGEVQPAQPPDTAREGRVYTPVVEQRPAPTGVRKPIPRHILQTAIPVASAMIGALVAVLLLLLDLGLSDFLCFAVVLPFAGALLGWGVADFVTDVLFPKPLSNSQVGQRYQQLAAVERAVRLVPKSGFSEGGYLGMEERAYVFVGDYAEQRRRSLREILENLWLGDAFDPIQSSNVEWVATVFDVGDLNRRKFDLMPATWKAVFRILSDPRRMGLIDATEEEDAELGPEQDRDYYAGDQRWWLDRIRTGRPGLEPGDAESLLEERFGISWLAYSGEGITEGQVPSRLFLVRNVALHDLDSKNWDLGSPDAGVILP